MITFSLRYAARLILMTIICPCILRAQTAPAEGIRKNTPAVQAFVNARIIQSPGKVIEKGTLVARDGVIQAVGASVETPPDARVYDMKGMTLYPGLIDAYSDYGLPKAPQRGGDGGESEEKTPEPRGARNWNNGILAQQSASELFTPDSKTAEKLRAQGITSALIVPTKGIFRGSSAFVNLGDGTANKQIVRTEVAQHVTFERMPGDDGYPGSLMGTIALIRQTILDAQWYQKAMDAYRKSPTLTRPEIDEALESLTSSISSKMPLVFESSDELNLLRADRIAREFSLPSIIRGSGNEYKRLDAVKAAERTLILPVNFPEPPAVQSPDEALNVSLAELRHWDEAPENPKRLHGAGIQIAFTSATLKDRGKFLGQVRKAVQRGLSADAALTALTTVPARLFHVENTVGSLEPGRIANIIVTDGDLFAEKTTIRETWIEGIRYEVKPSPLVDPRGTWEAAFKGISGLQQCSLSIKGEADNLEGKLSRAKDVKLKTISVSGSRLSISFAGDSLGHPGAIRMGANVEQGSLSGTGELPNGAVFTWTAVRIADFVPEPDTTKPTSAKPASFPPVYPFGEYGRARVPDQPAAVFVKGATIWTSGPQGKIENADMVVEKGKVVKVGTSLSAPGNAVVIEGTGKHVTAGLIDAHSHTAASGSVNEAGQAISAETRIGDVIDSEDMSIYRELAGGLTAAHVLHGSANPIGGQAQLIKLRWGMLPEEMKFEDAPPTIKFALGENVKQANWGDRYTTRYPQTRMGVEHIIRDEFKAALDYEQQWQTFEKTNAGLPPRRDLELETIVEILRGRRFIHCHSYRQDEILMLMRLGEELGFKVQVFQHILEGYKVADVMAQHGAGGSSFSDWWGYKLEVYDAIPHNGALMHEQGVLVSFNSDSDELARRMNLEAAKAVKYGGVPETEALKFVTLNPAKQLKVDHRVGSLEPGKDADFVIWSGNPLSTYTRCEQTWIEGRKYFDIVEDQLLRDDVAGQRAALVQKALDTKKGGGSEGPKPEKKLGDTYDHPHRDGEIEEAR